MCVGVCVLHQHNSLQQSPFGLDDKPVDANEMLHTVYVSICSVGVCVLCACVRGLVRAYLYHDTCLATRSGLKKPGPIRKSDVVISSLLSMPIFTHAPTHAPTHTHTHAHTCMRVCVLVP